MSKYGNSLSLDKSY